MQQKTDEKIDPLTRIQEEIKEVVRREEEYRQLATVLSSTTTPTPPPIQVEFENYTINNNGNDAEQVDNGLLVNVQTTALQSTTNGGGSLLVPNDNSPSNTPSLASSVNSNKEESLDEHHSDDSGISASSLSLKSNILNNNVKSKHTNNINNNNNNEPLKLNIMSAARQEQRYIGPNCYNMTPEPPHQKLMARGITTPQLKKRQFAFNSSTKGVMQRFIASHGKLQLGNSVGSPGASLGLGTIQLSNGPMTPAANGSQTLKLNTRNALAFLENGGVGSPVAVGSPISLSAAAIERDSEGRPLRRGYVPVEQKIKRELQDLKSRESELKRLRKLSRQNTLKQSLDKLQLSTDDEAEIDDEDDDSEEEHCYGPGKLRNAQSTCELDSGELELSYKSSGNRSLNLGLANGSGSALGNGMRPAMSLAQLCDLTPEEAPSSHRLIAQWESLIKKNAETGSPEVAI